MLDQRPEEGGRLREALQSRSIQWKGLEAESMVCWHEESGREKLEGFLASQRGQ